MDNKEMVQLAMSAKEKAYAPYSNFRVGAALLCNDGKIYTGCNIENVSFGGTNCAERTALFKAISEGNKNFIKIAIISDSANYTYPCGICRQVLAEFNPNLDIIVANNKGEFKEHKLSELLPYSFTNDDLERR
ncbi:cytidine deaminase [Fervidicella metallireducens AeB]|uniref:Cytidine deaminase n=1 Tax=Fervidicella metallireducens AeB TaxID=1403537 RepID=A0A017RUP0_9CLOT|nr:cytidine deaminase [Fervidicella metallireducens]EYE88124.1 cytidine deaminase [Fervidicella metallireducens AeB]